MREHDIEPYDPSNYAQNVLTAAHTLQQINNQTTQIQNQAQSLINQARNLANMPTNMLSSIQADIDRSQGSTGALQAAQAGNQLIALETKQLADLTAMLTAQARANAIESARAAADEAQGREQARRFTLPGTAYVPQSVALFHD